MAPLANKNTASSAEQLASDAVMDIARTTDGLRINLVLVALIGLLSGLQIRQHSWALLLKQSFTIHDGKVLKALYYLCVYTHQV